MYAIISDGGHQYKVTQGQQFEVQLKELPEGATSYTFDRIHFVGGADGAPKIGQPVVEGAKVVATIVNPELKGDKITIRKFRRRKNYARKQGHRQKFLQLRVERIEP